MKKMNVGKLVLDFALYPRADVDNYHVNTLAEALRAGCELPPVIIEKESQRVIDGFHRVRAHRRVSGDEAEIVVIEKSYDSEAEMFLDAMRYNAGHGRNLTQYDRTHCLLKAGEFKLESVQIAQVLHLTTEKVEELTTTRVGKLRSSGQVPLKQTIRHKAGKSLTKAQQTANEKLSGMNQLFYVNQLLLILDNDLLDTENERLMARLPVLIEKLESVVGSIVD